VVRSLPVKAATGERCLLGLSKRRKALITLATLIGTFLAALDATVVGTAMPTDRKSVV
jgi:hypothetical protein